MFSPEIIETAGRERFVLATASTIAGRAVFALDLN
ncbi:hypothetical protein V1281_006672 [Nitrobacteraceae bacterium AZCC 2161]